MAVKGISAADKAPSATPKKQKTKNPANPYSTAPAAQGLTAAPTKATPGVSAFNIANPYSAADAAQGVTPTPAKITAAATPPPNTQGNPGYNQGTTDPITGQIANYGYTPTGMAQIYDNPNILANDVLGTLGITNPGMGSDLAQYFDPALAANFILNQSTGSTSGDNQTLNFIAEYLQNMGTVNGRTPEFDALMNALFSGATSTNKGNALNAYLNTAKDGTALTPAQQVQAMNGLASQTLVGLNPYAQRAYQSAFGRTGQEYQDALIRGQSPATSYGAYFANSPIREWINR